MKTRFIFLIFLLSISISYVNAQQFSTNETEILLFEEYIAYVKKHHPLMKQSELTLSVGEANLLRARGGFDPKIEVDYNRKKFKNTEYYDLLNATFKIPTWYGVEFKANFEENTGAFLNESLSVPDGGLYSAGVSLSLAQGLLINERMASLKKARHFKRQTKADRDLLVNNLLYEASKAYFNWLEASNEQNIYFSFLKNASVRLIAIERSVEIGERPSIDITEARIILKTRELNYEAALLKRKKAALEVSNYLWVNSIPLELEENVLPEIPQKKVLEKVLELEGITDTNALLENHPKLLSLDAKIDGLTVDKALKLNKLLPKIDLQYNFLSQDYERLNTFNSSDYKAFVNFSFPLFLRKERGDLNLSKLKIKDANFDRVSTALNLSNKIEAVNTEIESLVTQNSLVKTIVEDYTALVSAEERKFSLGESSLFLINSREQKLIDAQLKENEILIKQLIATASLYNSLGIAI